MKQKAIAIIHYNTPNDVESNPKTTKRKIRKEK